MQNCDLVLKETINRAYACAKRWSAWTTGLQTFLYLAGVLAIFAPVATLAYPWVALPLAVLVVWLSDRATGMKGVAEALKREHELYEGFGIEPSKAKLAELRLALSRSLPQETDRLLREGMHFASVKPSGPVRVLENLAESSWFSKQHAAFCAGWLGALLAASVLGALCLLLLCVDRLASNPAALTLAKAVSATLIFMISVGALRSCLSYQRFSQKAGKSEEAAREALKTGNPDNIQAQRLLTEYQLARSSAPMIPTWVWRYQRNALNTSWKELKAF